MSYDEADALVLRPVRVPYGRLAALAAAALVVPTLMLGFYLSASIREDGEGGWQPLLHGLLASVVTLWLVPLLFLVRRILRDALSGSR
jgi:uncharacterized membrane protein